jgi:O-antigen/teichoic acid export membrane protein
VSAANRSLERRALHLGSANAIDYGLQFLLPVVLTRALDAQSFGEYRLLWLAASTLMILTPMFMSESLYYFLPRSDETTKRLYINQTVLWLAAGGLVSALVLGAWNPWLPRSLSPLVIDHAAVVPVFAFLYVLGYLMDVLPTVEERVGWQANVIVGLSLLRAVALSLAALITHDIGCVLWTLAALTGLKASLLVFYILKHHGLRGPWLRRGTFAGQVRYAAPFGLSGMLHGLRSQGDQWVAAALFPVTMFAAFSIATVVAPIVQLFRKSVNHVFLPTMSRSHSEGNVTAMLRLNSRANTMVALLVYPLLAFAFVFAEPLIHVIYTDKYLAAVPVLRLYTLGLLMFVVELNSILLLLKQGPYAAGVNAATLVVAVTLSYFGAMHFGLPGAALGSVSAIYLERLVSLTRISRLIGIPVAKLQDWSALSGILAAASLAATAAGAVMSYVSVPPLARLAIGAILLALVYPAALYLTGQRRELMGFIGSLRNATAQPAVAK